MIEDALLLRLKRSVQDVCAVFDGRGENGGWVGDVSRQGLAISPSNPGSAAWGGCWKFSLKRRYSLPVMTVMPTGRGV